MNTRLLLVSAATLFVATFTTVTAAPQAGRSGELPSGPGRDTLVRVCSDCHGLETIQGQRRTRREWQDVIEDMMSRGADVSDEDAKAIVDYLLTALGRVNVNRAAQADIGAVLELTPAEATAIVDYRTREGEFKTIDDLKKVPGLNVAKVEGEKDRIAFSGP